MIRDYIYQICATAKPPLPLQRREGQGKRHRCWLFLLLSTANNRQLNRVLGGNPGLGDGSANQRAARALAVPALFSAVIGRKGNHRKTHIGAEKCTRD
jgi:hypothetical protein